MLSLDTPMVKHKEAKKFQSIYRVSQNPKGVKIVNVGTSKSDSMIWLKYNKGINLTHLWSSSSGIITYVHKYDGFIVNILTAK